MKEKLKTIFIYAINILGIASGLATLIPALEKKRLLLIIVSMVLLILCSIVYVFKGHHVIANIKRTKNTFEKDLANIEEVWCIWHTGGVNITNGIQFMKKMKYKIILTKPNCNGLIELEKISTRTIEELNNDVKSIYRLMKIDENRDVKYFDGILGSSIIIANPQKENESWVKVEALVPTLDPKNRPNIKFFNSTDKALFEEYKNMFTHLWEKECIDRL